MAGFNETPIFPGKIDNPQGTLASGSSSTLVLTTAGTYGAQYKGFIMYEKAGVARTLRLELKDGSKVTVLKRFQSSGVQYTSTNLLSSTYILLPDIESDPVLRLAPGQILQITPEDSAAAAIDFTLFGATFEYPN